MRLFAHSSFIRLVPRVTFSLPLSYQSSCQVACDVPQSQSAARNLADVISHRKSAVLYCTVLYCTCLDCSCLHALQKEHDYSEWVLPSYLMLAWYWQRQSWLFMASFSSSSSSPSSPNHLIAGIPCGIEYHQVNQSLEGGNTHEEEEKQNYS